MPGSGPALGEPINTTALEQAKAERVGPSAPNPGSLRQDLPRQALVEQVCKQRLQNELPTPARPKTGAKGQPNCNTSPGAEKGRMVDHTQGPLE